MKVEYIFAKDKDGFCSTEEAFCNILSSCDRVNFVEENGDKFIKISTYKLHFDISSEIVERAKQKESLFHVSMETDIGSEEEQIKALEGAADAMRQINDKYQICRVTTLWNDISMYYAKKLYPDLVMVENLLRKIIYLFMLHNAGSDWFETNTPDKVKDNVKGIQKRNNRRGSGFFDDVLLYANFDELSDFLFLKYSLCSSEAELVDELKNVDNLTEEKRIELIARYEYKSNWERYFSDKLLIEKLDEKWKELYVLRNSIAHSRGVDRNEYTHAQKLIRQLRGKFEECIANIDNFVVTQEDKEVLMQVAQDTIISTQHETYSETRTERTNTYKNINYMGLPAMLRSDSSLIKGLYPAARVSSALNTALSNISPSPELGEIGVKPVSLSLADQFPAVHSAQNILKPNVAVEQLQSSQKLMSKYGF